MADKIKKVSDPSTTNKTARVLGVVFALASLLMIGLDGLEFYQANAVLVSVLLANVGVMLGIPTVRNIFTPNGSKYVEVDKDGPTVVGSSNTGDSSSDRNWVGVAKEPF